MRKTALALVLAFTLSAAPAAAVDPDPSTGQTIYLPVYSHIWHGDLKGDGSPERLLVSTLVSIRNTDPHRPITVQLADYYDTDGKLIRHYASEPRVIGPMGTIEYFINLTDTSGGSGANFLIAWAAPQPVSQPVVEGVHAYFRGTQSLGFVTTGRVIADRTPAR